MKKSDMGYNLIIIICVFIAAVLIFKMLFSGKNSDVYSDPQAPSQNQSITHIKTRQFFLSELLPKPKSGITLTSEQLSELVRDKISDKLPATAIKLSLSDDGSIGFSASFEKQTLFDFLSENNFEIPALLKSSINFLSDPLNICAVFSAETDRESSLLKFNTVSLKINSIDLVQSSALNFISEILTQSVNKVLCDSNYYFTDISIKNDLLELTPS